MTVKRGDAATVTLNLGVSLVAYSTATVVLRKVGADPVELTGAITAGTGGTVTATLPDTLAAGDYQVEVEMSPGPHTYPSDGYAVLSVVADLNP